MEGHGQRPGTRPIEDPADKPKIMLAKQGASTHEEVTSQVPWNIHTSKRLREGTTPGLPARGRTTPKARKGSEMSKHVTAIYRTHVAAREVKRAVEELGIGGHHVTVTPDDPEPVAPGTHREDRDIDVIDRLNLPDDDQRTYKRAVREGHYVVSVEVDDEAHIAKVKDAMRHSEHSVDIDDYETAYRSHPDYAADLERDRSRPAREGAYARDAEHTVPHARIYR